MHASTQPEENVSIKEWANVLAFPLLHAACKPKQQALPQWLLEHEKCAGDCNVGDASS